MYFLILILSNFTFFISCYLLLPTSPLLVITIAIFLVTIVISYSRALQKKQQTLVLSLEHAFLNFIDNDFSASLPKQVSDDFPLLFSRFEQASGNLRDERQQLYQRELLLDKVINTSPVITVLVNHRNQVVFANAQSQQLFVEHTTLQGKNWHQLIKTLPQEFQPILETQGNYHNNSDSIISSTDIHQQPQAWHISVSAVRLNQATHTLYLLKTITEQLAKQENDTWKKAMKVLSHELNNSIAPISSMCHSGKIITHPLEDPKLDRVFNAISRRINHLSDFVSGYASLAKLSKPIKKSTDINQLLSQIGDIYPFTLTSKSAQQFIVIDPIQIEQVLVNLLKNAQQAAPTSTPQATVNINNKQIKIDISDQGEGMSREVIQHALQPFYSTKHNGTGLGLALSRDIIEMHHGKLLLANKQPTGFCVSIILPC
ncbi:MAG: histidine kinase [Psychromonas sp.]|nr:histidine kinase [Psychromonas sp.]